MQMAISIKAEMSKPSVNNLLKNIWALEETVGLKTTLLGVGPMSKNVVQATLALIIHKERK